MIGYVGCEFAAGGAELQFLCRASLQPVQDNARPRLDLHYDAAVRKLSSLTQHQDRQCTAASLQPWPPSVS